MSEQKWTVERAEDAADRWAAYLPESERAELASFLEALSHDLAAADAERARVGRGNTRLAEALYRRLNHRSVPRMNQ